LEHGVERVVDFHLESVLVDAPASGLHLLVVRVVVRVL